MKSNFETLTALYREMAVQFDASIDGIPAIGHRLFCPIHGYTQYWVRLEMTDTVAHGDLLSLVVYDPADRSDAPEDKDGLCLFQFFALREGSIVPNIRVPVKDYQIRTLYESAWRSVRNLRADTAHQCAA